ncbi:Retrovirus-related Pol polyprotein from transposon TNT 1-94 [Cucumis melo var. makuwa]|uniref:Retrovirus-related Pol polyprotein from transposon TNT 1-94 n=2 Tax=Cucumis melo var. makuwa TaxID=1194695 RepID=A0A5A7T5B4_CUCMM|nr:Retrovirus-related Pol polyprotein from transposon TNT 1-94 [Cucumis melo var. makuwa]
MMYKHIYFVIAASAPVSLYSHATSIIKFNGLNFSDWCKQIRFHLGVLDLDLALLSEKPAAITSASSDEDRSFYKAWERLNRLSLMFMRMTVANNIKSTIKNTEDAKEFMKSVEKCSQSESADKSLAGTLMSTLTSIKFDGSRTIHEHILEMTNLAARLKTMGMKVNENFCMLIQEEARLKKPIIHSANLMGHKGARKKPGKKNGKGNHGQLKGFLTTQTTNPNEKFIFMGNRVKLPVEAVGTYRLTLDTGHHLDLFDTFYVPSISRNLISLSKLDTSGRKPSLRHLHVWGCQAEVRIYNPYEKKLDSRTTSDFFISYPEKSKGYRFYCLNHSTRIVETGNVRFIENDIISGSLESRKLEIQEVRVEIPSSITSSQVVVPVFVDSVNNPQEQQINVQTPHNDIVTNEPVTEGPLEIELRRSVRSRRSATSDDYLVYLHESEFDLSIDNDPVSFSQAIKEDNSTKWLDAMKEELKSMNDNEVWDIVELPKESYTQKDGIDYKETFSPVSKKDSLRIIMALVAHYDLELHQMDVKIVFLNGNLDEEVFMDQPEGFMVEGKEHMVCKLKRSIYGLKQASRQWYQSNPRMDHWKAAKKVLRYLQGTKDYMLTYKRSDHLEVIGYSDSDFAGCVDTRKSTFGYLFLLAEGAISWKRLGIVDSIAKPLRIYCDNSAAVFFSKNDKYSKGAKHMELKYFFVKEEVQKQRVSIEHISTKLVIANPLTKGLPPKTFNDHVERMGISRYHH